MADLRGKNNLGKSVVYAVLQVGVTPCFPIIYTDITTV